MLPPRYRLLLLCSLLTVACATAQEGLLLHYTFDEGTGAAAADRSGNNLPGKVTTAWATSPAGHAAAFDGQPAGVVTVNLPAAQRFGKGSWTFSAWLRPQQFTINDPQNQRRIFASGTYPDAYLVIDLSGNGQLMWYFCYKAADGKTVSTGGSAALKLALQQWAHVALVVDRTAGSVTSYVNGFQQGSTALPNPWDGDFSLGSEFSLGNGWHNYWGLLDEVKVARAAWPKAVVKAEFNRLKATFGVTESPEAAAAERREVLMEGFRATHGQWANKQYAAVRTACQALVTSPDTPLGLRSYAHLRIAQSYEAEGQTAAARTEYTKIAAVGDYPEPHRFEAAEKVAELDRVAKGLPAREVAASRALVPAVPTYAAQVWLSPQGVDANAGTQAAPVASLTRARDLVRALRARGEKGAIAVQVLPGEYPVAGPLELTAADSGSAAGPTVWRATEPGKATFYGGQRLRESRLVADPAILARLPQEARGKVVEFDLKAQGISDYGQLAVRGFAQPPAPPTLELYVNGRAQTLARWPNQGFVGIKRLVEPGDRGTNKPSVVEYLDDRHARWTQAEEPWLFGYFRYLWADATIKVSKIDPATKTLSCGQAYLYGPPGMHPGQGIQYYAFNLLEELDLPGEYYLDRRSGRLYLYPPSDLAQATVELGLTPTPMVTMAQVNHVRLEGLNFDLARHHGLLLTDCRNCLVAGCSISRFAGNGISILGGEANTLLGCDIHTIGRRASEVIGGDRATLTPGRHVVENCRIWDFGRIDRTYTPAVQLEGVGNRVAHNLMYNCPSSVMRIEGNDHLIEFNEVHSAVLESDDQGAMELFMNPTYRGVIFRYNRFTNCGKPGEGAAVHGQAAIRFDDAISDMVVYGNIFIRSANGNFGAVQMNSGRDNVMDNNLFIDCKQGVSGGWNSGNSVWRMIADRKSPAEFFTSALYLQRYPRIATMMQEPGINHLWRNVFYRCGRLTTGNQAVLNLVENGEFAETDPGFVDAAAGDYRLRPDAPLLSQVGFRPIPAEQIGLYQDRYRASWPVSTTPVTKRDWRAPAAGH
ncbi:MAG: right-handed parallel beta-helix repeat-containing protein [Fimbriimonadaceae bacterium]|nr:right-handed parallel beta-helix repeat-containing protein [Fimbriimonadaceae bacterium]